MSDAVFGREVGIQDSLKGSGTQSAPAAGTNVVSISAASGAIPAGVYRIKGAYLISGALEVAAANLKLNLNGGAFLTFPTNMNGSDPVPFEVERVTLDGTNAIQLAVVATATASTKYTAWLTATRIL